MGYQSLFKYTLWSVSAHYPLKFKASLVYQSGDAKRWWLKWKVKWCTAQILKSDPCILKFAVYFTALWITPFSGPPFALCFSHCGNLRAVLEVCIALRKTFLVVFEIFWLIFYFFFNFEKVKYKLDWTTLIHTGNKKM